MHIETFSAPPTNVTRNRVTVTLNANTYNGFLVSTYYVDEEGSPIKVAETIELLIENSWEIFLWDFSSRAWSHENIRIDTFELSIVDASTTNTVTDNSTTNNEGDIALSYHYHGLVTATTITGETLYGSPTTDNGQTFWTWIHLDGSAYTGDTFNLTIANPPPPNFTQHVEFWYAQIDASNNTWIKLLQIFTLNESGDLIQSSLIQVNGSVFANTNIELHREPFGLQFTEVWSRTSGPGLGDSIDFATLVLNRRLLAITINVRVPYIRGGRGRATLVLGNTRQDLTVGTKTYSDSEKPGSRIATFPSVTFGNGSRVDADLRFFAPPTIVTSLAQVASIF